MVMKGERLPRNLPLQRMEKIVGLASIAEGIDEPGVISREQWREIETSDRLEDWIEQLRRAEAATRKLRLRLQASLDGTQTHCDYCGRPFYARKGARYCSPSHRTMGNR